MPLLSVPLGLYLGTSWPAVNPPSHRRSRGREPGLSSRLRRAIASRSTMSCAFFQASQMSWIRVKPSQARRVFSKEAWAASGGTECKNAKYWKSGRPEAVFTGKFRLGGSCSMPSWKACCRLVLGRRRSQSRTVGAFLVRLIMVGMRVNYFALGLAVPRYPG